MKFQIKHLFEWNKIFSSYQTYNNSGVSFFQMASFEAQFFTIHSQKLSHTWLYKMNEDMFNFKIFKGYQIEIYVQLTINCIFFFVPFKNYVYAYPWLLQPLDRDGSLRNILPYYPELEKAFTILMAVHSHDRKIILCLFALCIWLSIKLAGTGPEHWPVWWNPYNGDAC